MQNKLLWAVSSQTAAELVHSRVDMTLPLLGMTSLDKTVVRKQDVNIAKNYLNEDEIKLLGLLVEQYLAFAEVMAQQKKVMYMHDWIVKLDDVISLNGRELLNHCTYLVALKASALGSVFSLQSKHHKRSRYLIKYNHYRNR